MLKFSELIRLSHLGRHYSSEHAQEPEQQGMVSQEVWRQKRPRMIAQLSVAVAVTILVLAGVMVASPPAGALNAVRPANARVADNDAQLPAPLPDSVSLAVVNPLNVGAHVTKLRSAGESPTDIIPVTNNLQEAQENEPASLIPIVTPTPTADVGGTPGEAPAEAPAPAEAAPAEAEAENVVPAAPGAAPQTGDATGVVLAGQQQAAPAQQSEPTVDPVTLSKLLEPLLEDQIDPKPLVIQLDIPSVSPQGPQGGLESAGLRAPSGSSGFPQILLLATPTPTSEPDRGFAAAVGVPVVEIVPAVGVKPTPSPTAAPTATPLPEPTPLWADNGPVEGRQWSTFAPRSPESSDHFWLENPFAANGANSFASPNYQFGSTAGGRYRPHHGVDISNPTGTPIRAAVSGEVIFAGPDDEEMLGPYNDFYGNAVVIRLDRKLPVAGGRLDIFVLYGHLSDVRTAVGERVEPSDIIGLVGMTGIAIGPHLHVEVRLGTNTYGHNVNPYLWLEPPAGSGAVAVRLVSDDGRTWAGAKVSIARFQGGAAVWARQIETYLDTENIGPDPAWGENGAMGDVPAGQYYLIGTVNGEDVRAEFTVDAGKTTFVEVRTQQ